MFISLPDAVLHAIHSLNDAGYEAFAVGGCVRDCLMGVCPQDWDITTSATPVQLQAVFEGYRTIDTGLKHGTLTVILDGMPLEITTYRIDGDYSDGRHPDSVSFTTSLTEDLRRRDFTINAMAYHPQFGLVDPFAGQTDLVNKIIRCVGVPQERFSEDALRILRALRFSSVLGFTIEETTAHALADLSPSLRLVSVERIHTEFQKLLCGVQAGSICKQYSQTISVFLPILSQCTDFHLLDEVRSIPHSRLAALFYGAAVSPAEAAEALQRLRMDNKTIRNVSLLLTPLTKGIYTEDSYLLRLLNRLGPELIFDYLAIRESEEESVQRVHQLLADQACYTLSMLAIGGEDVIAAGIHPGPAVGDVLDDVLLAVIDGMCQNNRESLINYIGQTKKPVQ